MPYMADDEKQCRNCKYIMKKEDAKCSSCGTDGSDPLSHLLDLAKVKDRETLELPLHC
jgi:hypothetical protein